MGIETDADRATFLDPDDFGVEVAWPSGNTSLISAIYDDTFVSLSAGDMDFAQSGSRYQIVVRTSDVPSGAANGNQITVGPASFKVLEMQPDGTGMTIVRLEDL